MSVGSYYLFADEIGPIVGQLTVITENMGLMSVSLDFISLLADRIIQVPLSELQPLKPVTRMRFCGHLAIWEWECLKVDSNVRVDLDDREWVLGAMFMNDKETIYAVLVESGGSFRVLPTDYVLLGAEGPFKQVDNIENLISNLVINHHKLINELEGGVEISADGTVTMSVLSNVKSARSQDDVMREILLVQKRKNDLEMCLAFGQTKYKDYCSKVKAYNDNAIVPAPIVQEEDPTFEEKLNAVKDICSVIRYMENKYST